LIDKGLTGIEQQLVCGHESGHFLFLAEANINAHNIGARVFGVFLYIFAHKELPSRDSRNIYIIENKDTFWSFKRNILDDPASRIKADMLIYGEGRKISPDSARPLNIPGQGN